MKLIFKSVRKNLRIRRKNLRIRSKNLIAYLVYYSISIINRLINYLYIFTANTTISSIIIPLSERLKFFYKIPEKIKILNKKPHKCSAIHFRHKCASISRRWIFNPTMTSNQTNQTRDKQYFFQKHFYSSLVI